MRRFLCSTLLACTAATYAASEPSLSVSPRIAIPPTDVRITARIPRDDDNRAFCVAAALGELVVRRSCQDIDADSPITHEFVWRDFREPGDYTVTLTVVTARGRITSTSTSLSLRGTDGDHQGVFSGAPPAPR